MGDMAHQLHWTPGNHGKGIVVPSGDVHTWNVEEETGGPHHAEYIEDGLSADERDLARNEFDPFEIYPDGLHDGPPGLEIFDPRLKQIPMSKWNFQAAAPIKIVPVEHGGQGGQYNTVPFVYDPAERTVYTGERGGYHNNLFEALGRKDWNLPQGKLHPPYTEENQYTGEVEEHPEELQWFGRPPENHEEIHQALGVPPLEGKWKWFFNSSHQLGWQPGTWGKGLVHNGDVHTWDTGVYDGQPTHPQYTEQNLDIPSQQYLNYKLFNTAFQIHPDGKVRFWDPVDNDLRDLVQSTHPHLDTYASPFDSAWSFRSRTANLISDMRDGWGRFAVAAPWELGKSGKGIYYPETGVLQTWADDRTHLDVWGDEDNYNQPGNAHHLIIRPNGTVRDQGLFDREFNNIKESDIPGLAQALKEFDPRLRLDSPSDWDFNHNATEPLEEEPSAVSRGETGGKDYNVQTSNDYAGSL
jgi:hypothetical protein